MYGSETISGFGPKIRDILQTELKIIVSSMLFKKKMYYLQRIALVVYVKRTYKTSDFCMLCTCTSLFFNMWYAIPIKESVEAVIEK